MKKLLIIDEKAGQNFVIFADENINIWKNLKITGNI